jgi:hypothetical protein
LHLPLAPILLGDEAVEFDILVSDELDLFVGQAEKQS